MLRDNLMGQLDHDPDFRWRGESVTRIENLSDIVFAIALGMLVSASSPPLTFTDLLQHLWQIVPVVAGFSILVLIWNSHFMFFRRYGVADGWIIFLNACLLLVVLFIAYPLRFIFDGLFGYLLGAIADDWTRMAQTGMGFQQSAFTVGLFAVGYAITFLIIALMYAHALRKREVLQLNEAETALTQRSVWHFSSSVILASIVAGLSFFTPLGPMAAALLSVTGLISMYLRRRFPIPSDARK